MLILYALVGVDPYVLSVALFKKFLRYYRECGISRIVLDLHTNEGDSPKVEEFQAVAKQSGAEVRNIIQEPFTNVLQQMYLHKFLQEYSSSQGWKLVVDGDEFIQFPDQDARRFFQECDEKSYNIVLGNLVDRLSLDCPFPEVGEDKSLDELFPWSYPLTRKIRGGWDRKLVAFKGEFEPIKGHHGLKQEFGRLAGLLEFYFSYVTDWIKNPKLRSFLRKSYPYFEIPAPRIRRWPGRLEIHHFAWDSLLKKKMEARLLDSSSTIRREFRNVLEFIESSESRGRLKAHLLQKIPRVFEQVGNEAGEGSSARRL